MKFEKLPINGAYLVIPELFDDERGFFAEIFNRRVFEGSNLGFEVAQSNISFNKEMGTLRGMHYQKAPYEEIKLIRCNRGAIFDAIIDLRQDSPSFCKWTSVKLSAKILHLVYVPKGCAHGYQTLEDNTEVMYIVSEFYHPESARGIRWNDPHFQIDWPICKKVIVNSRDASYPDFNNK